MTRDLEALVRELEASGYIRIDENLGQRLSNGWNKAVGGLGFAGAQGKFDTGQVIVGLEHAWKQYLGQTANRNPNKGDLARFLNSIGVSDSFFGELGLVPHGTPAGGDNGTAPQASTNSGAATSPGDTAASTAPGQPTAPAPAAVDLHGPVANDFDEVNSIVSNPSGNVASLQRPIAGLLQAAKNPAVPQDHRQEIVNRLKQLKAAHPQTFAQIPGMDTLGEGRRRRGRAIMEASAEDPIDINFARDVFTKLARNPNVVAAMNGGQQGANPAASATGSRDQQVPAQGQGGQATPKPQASGSTSSGSRSVVVDFTALRTGVIHEVVDFEQFRTLIQNPEFKGDYRELGTQVDELVRSREKLATMLALFARAVLK